jgi:hypothetical protein
LWGNPPYNPADPHNAMLDKQGRVWMTSKIRPNAPSWCADASNRFADWFPLRSSGRQASYYDPTTKSFTLIDTCYATHHLQFDTDANQTLYFNELTGPVVGWIDTKVYDDTLRSTRDELKAEQAAVGWCGQVVDTNGDGRITRPWNRQIRGREGDFLYAGDTGGQEAQPAGRGRGAAQEGDTTFDPKRDTLVSFSLYSVIPSPVDDSVWGGSETYPGYLIRMQRGNNPPESCKTQIFKVPEPGFDPRGVDIDKNGVVWTALAASSHLARFDVRQCKDLTGPAKPDGTQCREGWTLYQTGGPTLKNTDVPADFHYYNWVDQHDILGMGANMPIAAGSNSDALLVLNPETGGGRRCACPIPSVSITAGSMGESTIRRPVGRAVRSMPTMGPISSGISKAAGGPGARSSNSKFAQTRWRADRERVRHPQTYTSWQATI